MVDKWRDSPDNSIISPPSGGVSFCVCERLRMHHVITHDNHINFLGNPITNGPKGPFFSRLTTRTSWPFCLWCNFSLSPSITRIQYYCVRRWLGDKKFLCIHCHASKFDTVILSRDKSYYYLNVLVLFQFWV